VGALSDGSYTSFIEPADLTVRILQEIRDELRAVREDTAVRFETMSRESASRFEA
jgi:hypothetical protein